MHSIVASMTLKLLVWLAALSVFLRLLGRDGPAGGTRERQELSAMLLGALVGSKLLAIATRPVLVLSASDLPEAWLMFVSADSVTGALLGARAGLWFAGASDRGAKMADRLVRPTAWALIVLWSGGVLWALRDGDYGGPTRLPWGIDFGDGLARHPVMLYQAMIMLVLMLFDRLLASTGPPAGLRGTCFVSLTVLALACVAVLKAPFHVPLIMEWVTPRPHLYFRLATAEQWAGLIAALIALPRLWAGLERIRERL